jgi:predicted nuclease with TOPRIM domain
MYALGYFWHIKQTFETMSNTKVHLNELHAEHTQWLQHVEHYEQEIAHLQAMLDDLAKRNNSNEFRKACSHFQNQLIIHKEQLDILRHNIRVHEDFLVGEAQKQTETIHRRLFGDHADERSQVQTFEKLFAEMKADFLAFAGKWS